MCSASGLFRGPLRFASLALDESLAHPREIFRAVIVHAAAGFVLVHNLWGAAHKLCGLRIGLRIYVRHAGERI
jgi:hypothetical protein